MLVWSGCKLNGLLFVFLSYTNFIPDLWNGWRYHDEIIEKQQKEIDYLKSVIKDLINK